MMDKPNTRDTLIRAMKTRDRHQKDKIARLEARIALLEGELETLGEMFDQENELATGYEVTVKELNARVDDVADAAFLCAYLRGCSTTLIDRASDDLEEQVGTVGHLPPWWGHTFDDARAEEMLRGIRERQQPKDEEEQ